MNEPGASRRVRAVVAAVIGLQLGISVVSIFSDRALRQSSHPDLGEFHGEYVVVIAAFLAANLVGAAIINTQPRHPVGWLFLGLAGAMTASSLASMVAYWGAIVHPGSIPGAGIAASADNSAWIAWFALIALILLLTPTGTYLTPRWRRIGQMVTWSGLVSFALALFRTELDTPYENVENPIAVDRLQWLASGVSFFLILFVAAGLVASGVSLVIRWRRSRGDEKRRLLWLAIVVVPLPVFVLSAFVASKTNHQSLMLLAVGGFVTLIPIAAGLSIMRYHLYDVERVLARTTSYSLLTVVLVATYAGIVWLGARGAGRWTTTPEVAATVGALTVAVLAAPLRRALQDAIDRRFNRRRYDAVRLISRTIRSGVPGLDLTDLLRQAFDDPSVTIAYPGARPDAWVTAEGVHADDSGTHVDVVRHERVVARVGFDPGRVDVETVEAGGRVAAVELDNARLRAELARQLVEVDSSRRRIAEAQRQERRRIERDLHDGAQQRLLALAFELQSAQLSGETERMKAALGDGATAAQEAVRDLRALANGLHPAALADGGLTAALDDLRAHATVPLALDVEVGRLDAAVEFAAWLVVGEAVVNAQKHAGASEVAVMVRRCGDELRFEVRDDGCGGANPKAPGLRGLRDRVEATGGTVRVESPPGRGTVVAGVIPCAS